MYPALARIVAALLARPSFSSQRTIRVVFRGTSLCEPQFEPAQGHISCPKEMILRERQFLAHIDEREFGAIIKHGLDRRGREGTKLSIGSTSSYRYFMTGLVLAIHLFNVARLTWMDKRPPVRNHVACCAYIFSTAPVFRSILMRSILSRLVPVTRMKRA